MGEGIPLILRATIPKAEAHETLMLQALYNYLPFWQHVVEFILANVVFGSLLGFTNSNYYPARKWNKIITARVKKTLSLFERLLFVLLLITFVSNCYYKSKLGLLYISNMTFPCHVLNILWLLIFACRSSFVQSFIPSIQCHKISLFTFNILVFLIHNAFIALAFPDTTDCKFFLQIPMYYIQHSLLVLIPFYYLYSQKLEVDRSDYYFLLLSIATSGLFHYDVHLILGLYTHVNVNYLIWPPPGLPFFVGRFYRPKLIVALACAEWISGYPVIVIAQWIFTKLRNESNKDQNIRDKKKEEEEEEQEIKTKLSSSSSSSSSNVSSGGNYSNEEGPSRSSSPVTHDTTGLTRVSIKNDYHLTHY